MTGPSADQARQAESRRRGGHPDVAVSLLEDALEASVALQPELPGWLCGRLAALYRSLGRYDDEVALLERYRDSQQSEEARSRYDARLSKARTVAERKRRSDSGALASVRVSMSRPSPRRSVPVKVLEPALPLTPFSDEALDALTIALAGSARAASAALEGALAHLCAEAHEAALPLEGLVGALKQAYDAIPSPRRQGGRDTRYDSALLVLLALYYKEQAA
ncbi:MAG: hypothetical protein ABJA80_00170 [bacterium]